MTVPLTCGTVEELAPELALGQLPGHERAAVLAHLAGCVGCRTLVEELSAVADSLLLLAPEDEPPVGFESRVVEQLSDIRGTGRRRRVVLAVTGVAAAVLVGVAAVLSGATFERHSDQSALRVNKEYVATLRQLGGRSVRGCGLARRGRPSGRAGLHVRRRSLVGVRVGGRFWPDRDLHGRLHGRARRPAGLARPSRRRRQRLRWLDGPGVGRRIGQGVGAGHKRTAGLPRRFRPRSCLKDESLCLKDQVSCPNGRSGVRSVQSGEVMAAPPR